MRRGHLPYRGQPNPKYPKRKRQARNLRNERIKNILTIGALSLLFVGLLFFFVFILKDSFVDGRIEEFPGEFVLFGIGFIVVIIAVSDGLKNINKFRKGFDIDISGKHRGNDEDNNKEPDEDSDA